MNEIDLNQELVELRQEVIRLKERERLSKKIIKVFVNYFGKGTPDLFEAKEFLKE